jgi:hypothetical protein
MGCHDPGIAADDRIDRPFTRQWSGTGPGIVLGDAEVVPVFGMVIFVMGILVIIQEWAGLT